MAITKATASSIAPAAKGSIVVGSATNDAGVLAVGTNTHILVADSTETLGMKWAAPAGGGKVLQVVSASAGSGSSTTSTSFVDTNLTVNITPTLNTSKILVLVSQMMSADKVVNANMVPSQQLLRGSTVIASSDCGRFYYATAAQVVLNYVVTYTILDAPATTSALTYKTQHKVNGSDMTSTANAGATTITVLEIGA